MNITPIFQHDTNIGRTFPLAMVNFNGLTFEQVLARLINIVPYHIFNRGDTVKSTFDITGTYNGQVFRLYDYKGDRSFHIAGTDDLNVHGLANWLEDRLSVVQPREFKVSSPYTGEVYSWPAQSAQLAQQLTQAKQKRLRRQRKDYDPAKYQKKINRIIDELSLLYLHHKDEYGMFVSKMALQRAFPSHDTQSMDHVLRRIQEILDSDLKGFGVDQWNVAVCNKTNSDKLYVGLVHSRPDNDD